MKVVEVEELVWEWMGLIGNISIELLSDRVEFKYWAVFESKHDQKTRIPGGRHEVLAHFFIIL